MRQVNKFGANGKARSTATMRWEALEPRVLLSADPLGAAGADFAALPGQAGPDVRSEDLDAIADALAGLAPNEQHFAQAAATTPDAFDLGSLYGAIDVDDAALTADYPGVEQPTELVVVDTRVADFQQVLDDLVGADGASQYEIVLLDADADGIAQLTAQLDQGREYSAVHVISHGREGELLLGDAWLDAATLTERSAELARWAGGLTDGADLLFYGCNLAASERGQAFMEAFSRYTGADVAASDDLTGHAVLGGDWELELNIGEIESDALLAVNSRQAWMGTLSTDYIVQDSFPLETGKVDDDENFGQSFSYTSGSGTYNVNQITLWMAAHGGGADPTIVVTLRSSWDGTVLGSDSVVVDMDDDEMMAYTFDFADVALTDGDTYYIRVDRLELTGGHVHLGSDDSGTAYAGGTEIVNDGAPDPLEDLAFKVSNSSSNNVPNATNLDQVRAYTEGDATVALNDIVVTDTDSGETITATLTLADTAAGSLSANDGASYDGLTGVWTITDTVANVNTALANAVFNPATQNDLDTSITTHIEDAAGAGPADGSIALNVTPVNDEPLATNLNQTIAYNEGDPVVAINDIVVSDPDDGDLIFVELKLDNTDAGTLSANDGATYDAGNGKWEILDTVANVNIALANVVFNPNAENDVDTDIKVTVRDLENEGPEKGTIDLVVTPSNDPPAASNLNQVRPYNVGDPSVTLNNIVVTDVDSGETITATLTLNNILTGSLSANDGASYSGLTGIWTITDTVANVNTALANVVFNPLPLNVLDTTITTHIEDAAGAGPVDGSIVLDVTVTNDVPSASNLDQVVAYNEGDATVALDDIVVSDTDVGEVITATLTLADTATGSLSANDGASYNGLTGIWTISGTVANVNTALANVVFNPATENDVNTVVTTHIEDAAGTGPADGSIALNVTPANDPPAATNLDQVRAYNEGDATVALNDIVVTDADSGETITATLTLADTATGSLSANDGASYDGLTGVWTITDTVANVNTALANVVFSPVLQNDVNTTITTHVEDAAGAGPADGSIALNVTPANDAPTATNLDQVRAYNEGDPTVAFNDIVVTDIDSNDTITATLTLADTATGSLSANDGASYNGLTGIWTITDTVANVNTALANVVFNPAATNDVDTVVTTHIEDAAGAGPVDGSIALNVSVNNDVPTATNMDQQRTYLEGALTVNLDDIVVTDADSGETITATLTLADTAAGSLRANGGASYDGRTGVWTITDTVANVNRALANLVFNPAANNELDTFITTHIEDSEHTGPADGTIALRVTPVNGAPVATNLDQVLAYSEGETTVALNDIVVSDRDRGEIITATLTLADTNAGSLSANDGASYDRLSGVWTITGSLANVNTALANVVFSPVADNAANTVIFTHVEDAAGTGPADGSIALNVSLTNDAPTATNLVQVHTFDEGASVVALDDIVVTDRDRGEIITATLTLADTAAGSLTPNDGASWDARNGVWTITGSVANVNAALANVAFSPVAEGQSNAAIAITIVDAAGADPLQGEIELRVRAAEVEPDPGFEGPVEIPESAAPPPVETPVEDEEQEAPEDDDATAEGELAAVVDAATPEDPAASGGTTETEAQIVRASTVPAEFNASYDYDNAYYNNTAIGGFDLQGITSDFDNATSSNPQQNLYNILVGMEGLALDSLAAVYTSSSFSGSLDDLRNDMVAQQEWGKVVIEGSIAVSSGLSVGYVAWLVRSGVILSTLLGTLPAWRFIDPTPVLATMVATDDEDDESLESMVADAQQGDDSDDEEKEKNP